MVFIKKAVEDFDVQIFSSRSNQSGGIDAMQDWLREHMVTHFVHEEMGDQGPLDVHAMADAATEITRQVSWPTEKPPAMVSIDDRCLTFTGSWPAIEDLKAFKPWNK